MTRVVLSALLLAGAYLPAVSPLLVLVALVPLWSALDRVGDGRRGAELGAWFGVTFWAVHLLWVPRIGLRIDEAWPWMAWAGQTALLGLLGAGAGAGFVLLRKRRGWGLVPAAVVAWVGVEWLRGHLLGPLSFPWAGIALPLARIPILVQPAAWGGETLVAAGVVAANAALAASLPSDARSGGAPPARPLAGLALGLALWTGFGWARTTRLESRFGPQARAVVVQPAVPLEDKRGPRGPEIARASLRWGLGEAAGRLGQGGETLVIFPETHLPFAAGFGGGRGDPARMAEDPGAGGGPGPWPEDLTDEISGWAAAHGATVLVGAYRRDERGIRNALLQVGPAGLEGAYDKVALVPGVERGPGGLVPGEDPRPLPVQGDAGVLICIESAWAPLARRQARAGAGWLLNVTNDAWLGEAGARSAAFDQHPWHLVFRSVETGLGALRVANNGWTGSVDPLGRWQAALRPDHPGVAALSVAALPGATPFVRVGDLLGPLSLILLLVGAAVSRPRSPR